MNTRLSAAFFVVLLVATAAWSYAGGYDLSWFTIDGGGVMFSSDGQPGGFELSGTIGQHDAGPVNQPMIGGDFELVGGFWPGAMSLPPVPGDADGDGRVDLADYLVFYDCMAGPDATPSPPPPTTPEDCLAAFDFAGDQDVDLPDFAEFVLVFTGP